MNFPLDRPKIFGWQDNQFTSHGSGKRGEALQLAKTESLVRSCAIIWSVRLCVRERKYIQSCSAMIQRWRLKHGKPWREKYRSMEDNGVQRMMGERSWTTVLGVCGFCQNSSVQQNRRDSKSYMQSVTRELHDVNSSNY